MSSGLLVDMAFWTFKTVISVFPCVMLQYKKKCSPSISFWHSVCSQLIFYSKAPKTQFCFLFKTDFLSIVCPWIISFVPRFSSCSIMRPLLMPWELRTVMTDQSEIKLGECWPQPSQWTTRIPLWVQQESASGGGRQNENIIIVQEACLRRRAIAPSFWWRWVTQNPARALTMGDPD